MNREEIKKIIPHREPFIFIDEASIIVPGEKAVGRFEAKKEYSFFEGHFPGNPVLPGVIMVEASAQLGACLLLSLEENRGKTAYFAGIEEFKFKRIVRPGEVLEIEVELISRRGKFGKGKVRGRVGNDLAFEGVLTFFVA